MVYMGSHKANSPAGIIELPLFTVGDFTPSSFRTAIKTGTSQFKLVATSDSAASPFRVQTRSNGIMSFAKKVVTFTEDWNAFSANYSLSNGSYTLQTDSGNYLRTTATNEDIQLRLLNIFSLDPYTWRYLEIRYRTPYVVGAEIFYMMSGRTNDYWGNPDQAFNWGLNSSNTWTVYVKDLWELPYYRGYGNFTGFRYDTSNAGNAIVDIDYIKIWRA